MNMLLLKGRSYAQHALTALTSVNVLTPGWAYVFRSAAAVALAYAVAYSLQLDRAYSAANSVMLVASASQGATLGKGASRLAGTIIGGIAAIVLLGLTIQAPALFLIGYGLWLGMCSAAATVSRHFRSTTFAVLGYTVGFAAYEVLENPAHAFNGVAARIATVAVGVVCLGVVSALFSRRATREKLESAIALQLGKWVGSSLRGLVMAANLPPKPHPSRSPHCLPLTTSSKSAARSHRRSPFVPLPSGMAWPHSLAHS
ncbi:hypothetical protein HBN82_07575 [Pseudomonas lundensis]|uniref:FUSC family protein n=1 Tax=Pseudomonas lundensis TaxID=86185 RepID=UPI0014755EAB|nr:FUSC family protein [Pseudomonas lundensis]NNA15726.1 hypothetical protein [Pseudomonas lundensis]